MLKLFDYIALRIQKKADYKGYDIDNSIPYINACHITTMIEWKEYSNSIRNWCEAFYLLYITNRIIKHYKKVEV